MRETRVLQALRALAEHDCDISSPPEVETRLTVAFRARQAKRASESRRVVRWTAACSIAAAAAIVVFVIVDQPRNVGSRQTVEIVPTSRPEAMHQTPKAQRPETSALAHPLGPKISRRLRKPARVEEQGEREVVTDFFPLMDPAPPFDRGQILRVQLPAAAMQAVGLPVGDDHLDDQIQADVLVGEEGLPRAIRFVRFEMK